jgi:biopolymer transport protein ExbB/TolQ
MARRREQFRLENMEQAAAEVRVLRWALFWTHLLTTSAQRKKQAEWEAQQQERRQEANDKLEKNQKKRKKQKEKELAARAKAKEAKKRKLDEGQAVSADCSNSDKEDSVATKNSQEGGSVPSSETRDS